MKRSIVFQTLGLAGLLAALPTLSLLADDLHTSTQPQATYIWGAEAPNASGSSGSLAKNPAASNYNGITYLTGGIGNEERDEMEAIKSKYDLHVTVTDSSGDFESDSHVVIRDRSGNPLLDVSTGPMFFANLPRGTYTVEISNAKGIGRKQTVIVGGAKPLSIYFRE